MWRRLCCAAGLGCAAGAAAGGAELGLEGGGDSPVMAWLSPLGDANVARGGLQGTGPASMQDEELLDVVEWFIQTERPPAELLKAQGPDAQGVTEEILLSVLVELQEAGIATVRDLVQGLEVARGSSSLCTSSGGLLLLVRAVEERAALKGLQRNEGDLAPVQADFYPRAQQKIDHTKELPGVTCPSMVTGGLADLFALRSQLRAAEDEKGTWEAVLCFGEGLGLGYKARLRSPCFISDPGNNAGPGQVMENVGEIAIDSQCLRVVVPAKNLQEAQERYSCFLEPYVGQRACSSPVHADMVPRVRFEQSLRVRVLGPGRILILPAFP